MTPEGQAAAPHSRAGRGAHCLRRKPGASTIKTVRPTTISSSGLQWWPVLVGILAAASVSYDMASGREMAPILVCLALVYLSTSVLGRPTAAWAVLGLTLAATIAVRMVTGWNNIWTLLMFGAAALAVGLWDRQTRRSSSFRLQAAAMLALGLLSIVALRMHVFWGSLLVAAGLFSHAGWDLYHHRKALVVSQSLAEFCFVFDALLAIAIILTAL